MLRNFQKDYKFYKGVIPVNALQVDVFEEDSNTPLIVYRNGDRLPYSILFDDAGRIYVKVSVRDGDNYDYQLNIFHSILINHVQDHYCEFRHLLSILEDISKGDTKHLSFHSMDNNLCVYTSDPSEHFRKYLLDKVNDLIHSFDFSQKKDIRNLVIHEFESLRGV